MESLRWILLGIGIVLVVMVYLWGRSRKKSMDYSPLDAANDVPNFSARDSGDDIWKDGVGPVRVVRRDRVEALAESLDDDDIPEIVAKLDEPVVPAASPASERKVSRPEPRQSQASPRQVAPEQSPQVEQDTDLSTGESSENVAAQPRHESLDESADVAKDDSVSAEPAKQHNESRQANPEQSQQAKDTDDVVALYIVADRGHELKGEQILGASMATHLEYGEMNIFHRLDEHNQIMFSMANMMEPGWFDYEQMHNLKTRGITLFAQLKLCDDAVATLDEMLICAHTLATMLGAQLCDPNRQLLNESMARSLREKARYYFELKHNKQQHQDA